MFMFLRENSPFLCMVAGLLLIVAGMLLYAMQNTGYWR